MPAYSQETLQRILSEIKSDENKGRKEKSLKEFDIYQDRIYDYVRQYLLRHMSEDVVNEMPIISTLNLAKKIVESEASIYRTEPKRTFHNVTPEQEEKLQLIYDDMSLNQHLFKSNIYYKLQHQNIMQILPVDGKLRPRVFLMHHIDVIPRAEMPEIAEAYIISAFDKNEVYMDFNINYDEDKSAHYKQDFMNQKIADADDFNGAKERYVFWSKEENFIFNGKKQIISQDIDTPIPGVLPFIDICSDKDFEFFKRVGNAVAAFTIEYNAYYSDLYNIARNQGFGQAVYSGDEALIPESLKIGPAYVLRLPVDPNNPVPTTFDFVSPNADLTGSLSVLETMLATFLTSRGIDPRTISGKGEAQNFSSGIERLLHNLEKFEASRTDIAVYRKAEDNIFDLVKVWSNVLRGTDKLDRKYQMAELREDAYVEVNFEKPEMFKTEAEQLDIVIRKLEAGLISDVEAIMELRNLDKDAAIEVLTEINQGGLDAELRGQATAPAFEGETQD